MGKIFAFCCFSLVASVAGASSVVYVSPTGDDSATGDSGSPLATISAAVAALGEEGGTVYVAAGTYVETGTTRFTETESRAAGNTAVIITTPVEIVGQTGNPEDVIITRGSNSSRIFALNNPSAKLQDITIYNGYVNDTEGQLGGNVVIGSAGGVVDHCILKSGEARKWDSGGGNLGMFAGHVTRCVFIDGRIQPNSGVSNRQCGNNVCMKGGIVENSLMTSSSGGYGAVAMYGESKLLSCTIAGNVGSICTGVAIMDKTSKQQIVNCLIAGNTSTNDVWATGGAFISYPSANNVVSDADMARARALFVNCMSDVQINENCLAGVCRFVAADNGDFRPAPGSASIDAGIDCGSYGSVSEVDLAGVGRVMGSAQDIGCYEFNPNVFAVDFDFVPRGVLSPVTVDCRTYCSGSTGLVTYHWDLDGDGVADRSTMDSEFEWQNAPLGTWNVRVWATDSIGRADAVKVVSVKFAPSLIYVAPGGNSDAAEPYDQEYTAAPDLQTAVNYAVDGTTIQMLPGVHRMSGIVTVSKGVWVKGDDSDLSRTMLSNTLSASWQTQNTRVIGLDHPSALVSGLTLAKGVAYYFHEGANAYISAAGGTVSNCLLTAGVSDMNAQGAGAYVEGGLLTHCKIIGNTANLSSSKGITHLAGVIGAKGSGRIENCLIADNTVTGQKHVCALRGTSSMVNCTFVDNASPAETDDTYGGSYLVYLENDKVRIKNSAFIGNLRLGTGSVTPFKGGGTTNMVCCAYDGTADFGEGHGCIQNVDASKAFANRAAGNYVPGFSGALYNAGSREGSYPSIDLAGMPRISGKIIDIGCYEAKAPTGLRIFLR